MGSVEPLAESTFRFRRPSAAYPLAEAQITTLKDYLIHRSKALDRDLLPHGDPAGKDVLVFGCGYGNEVLWAVQHGARSVLAIDLSAALSAVPFERAMQELGLTFSDYEFRRENVFDTALSGNTFDLIVSNGVFEHVMDLKGTLGAFRGLLNPRGRVAIFADGLWYSSIGGHIRLGPWEHLCRDPAELKAELPADRWAVFCQQLNRMTVVDFIQAVRSADMAVLGMVLRTDPNLRLLPGLLATVRERLHVPLADLTVVSIGCTLCFEENL